MDLISEAKTVDEVRFNILKTQISRHMDIGKEKNK